MIRVLALAPYPARAPSTRYRLEQLIAPLRAAGVELTLRPFLDEEAWARVRDGGVGAARALMSAVPAFRRVVASAGDHDAVLVQRGLSILFDGAFLRTLRRSGRPLVYDFDDAVYLPQAEGRWWVERLRRPGPSTEAFCLAAAEVTAGNRHLAAWARSVRGAGGGDRVRVVPSVVDTERFRPAPGGGPPRRRPTLGWVGSDSTLPYLESLAPALRRLRERIDHRLVVVAGRRAPRLPGVEVDFRPWRPEAEVAAFHELDVGLYPLDDTPWSRGKCGFKAIQYLACGVPCVASPVGVLREIVRPGETGLHAESQDEWADACALLLGDPERRAAMGRAGRTLVVRGYSTPVAVEGLTDAFEGALGRGGRG